MVVVAYVSLLRKIPLLEALAFIKEKRKIANMASLGVRWLGLLVNHLGNQTTMAMSVELAKDHETRLCSALIKKREFKAAFALYRNTLPHARFFGP